MIYMIITLFIISVIEFSIYLILEYMAMKNNKNQKLNEHDKLNTNCSRDICGSREDSRENDNTK